MMYVGTPRDYEFYIAIRVLLKSLATVDTEADLVVIASVDVPPRWIRALGWLCIKESVQYTWNSVMILRQLSEEPSICCSELIIVAVDCSFVQLLRNAVPLDIRKKRKGGGVIQGTASEAVLVVLLAARDKILRRVGRNALPKLVMYAYDQTHSALLKAWQVGTTSSTAVDPLLALGKIAKVNIFY
ncbi:Tyrosine decarboxylase 1 [Glycine soja]|uniref:Tyrosine decarboxylase 1 n=1 Tax=Glycine soja TaxID=3848 RepID=A0A445FC16_GLYSO|nr:Tyrosine decarboxylase 1 [Glycine soja]